MSRTLRDEVRETLASVLSIRPDDAPFSLFGGGRGDDLDEARRVVAGLADSGLLVCRWPREHGGRGADPVEAAVIAEEVDRFDVPDLYPFLTGLSLVGPTLIAEGSGEQRARWLAGIRSGEQLWCQLFSEPDAGSDLAALTTRAVPDAAGGWRITGSKVWSSRAHYAERGFLLARTDSSSKHRGITAFGIDMAAPGIDVRPLRQINGDAHFNEVFLDDVPVPDADRIGAVGHGWTVTVTALTQERSAIGGTLGMSRQQFRRMVRGATRGADSGYRDRILSAATKLEIARLNEERVQAGRLQGHRPGPEGSIGKLWMADTLKELADLSLDLQGLGGTGFVEEWTAFFLTSPSLSIRGGTDEIQRNILAERVLGLPRE